MQKKLKILDEYAILIGESLLDKTWPIEKWRHAEHCIATLYLVRIRKDLDLIVELPNIIKNYNIANGGINNETSGYHHTITMFYLYEIQNFSLKNEELSLGIACEKMLETKIGDKDYPLEFWSKQLLFSTFARLNFAKPDVKEINWNIGFNPV